MTLKSLARLAGVSPSVASTALGGGHGTTRVSEKTRRRIRALAAKHGFQPNPHARAVRSAVRATVFVSTRWDNAYENEVKRLLHAAWKARGAELQFLTWVDGPDERFLPWLASWNPARVILFDLWRQVPSGLQAELAGAFERVLVLQRGARAGKAPANVHFCDIDTEAVMADVFAYAQSKGRRRMAALLTEKAASAPRSDALRLLEKNSGGAFSFARDAWEIPQGELPAVYDAVRQIAATRRYDVLFAHHDQLAPVVYKAIGDCGLRIPRDLAVIGMDDIPQSAFLSPALTTVRIHREDFAAASLAWLDGGEGHARVRHELVPRESA